MRYVCTRARVQSFTESDSFRTRTQGRSGLHALTACEVCSLKCVSFTVGSLFQGRVHILVRHAGVETGEVCSVCLYGGTLRRFPRKPFYAGLKSGSAVGGPRKAAVLHTWVGQSTAYSDTPRQSCLHILRGCSCVHGLRGHGVLLSTFVMNVFHFAELVKRSFIYLECCMWSSNLRRAYFRGVCIYTLKSDSAKISQEMK